MNKHETELPPLDVMQEEIDRALNLPDHQWEEMYENRAPVELVAAQFCRERQLLSAQQHIANLESELQMARDLIQQMRQQLSAANLGSAMQHERYGSY